MRLMVPKNPTLAGADAVRHSCEFYLRGWPDGPVSRHAAVQN